MASISAAESANEPIRLVLTSFGRPALRSLHSELAAAKAKDPLAPATVIVPNNFVGVATRRAIASGGYGPISGDRPGLAGVTFLTVYRLAELLGASALASDRRRPVSTALIAAATRVALREEPGIFAPVAAHPTTERRLVEAHRELSEVDRAGLSAIAGSGARAREVVRLHRSVESRLERSWYDEQDLISTATDVVRSTRGERTTAPYGRVIVFLPDRLSPTAAKLIESLGATSPVTVIAALTGASDADTGTKTVLSRLGVDPAGQDSHKSEHGFTTGGPGTGISMTSVSDADDEVRHAVRGILQSADEGIAFDAMAVVYASDAPYARLLHDHLGAAGIPFNGAAVGGLADSVVGRTLTRLLHLGERDYRRDEVLGLISSLPFRWGDKAAPTRRWDQISRDAGVVSGVQQWRLRLQRHAADHERQALALGADPDNEWRVDRLKRSASAANDLSAFVDDLATRLDSLTKISSWSDFAKWCRRSLRFYLGDLSNWPLEQTISADKIDAILQRLASLDAIDESPELSGFARTLEMELDGGLGTVGRFGDGVLAGRPWSTMGLVFDRVWVLGLSEGTFPSRPREDSLLPDRDRALASGQLPLRRDRVGEEHRQLLATIASTQPDGRAHLLRPRGDLRGGNERTPSRWLNELVDSADREEQVPSFAHAMVTNPFPAHEQEHALGSLVHLASSGRRWTDYPLGANADFTASAEMNAARRSTGFTRFDGNVGPDLMTGTALAKPTSPTALESWVKCPHAYFVRQILGVYPVETPEARLRIDALDKGNLIHSILEDFISEQIQANGSGAEYRRWSENDRRRLHEIAADRFTSVRERGLTGETLYWRRDKELIRRTINRFIDDDNTRRGPNSLRPVHTELAFGMRGAEPVQIDLGGTVVRLRGSIDLVDVAPDGTINIIDYKTGKKTRTVEPDDPHEGGKGLQPVLYALAARSILEVNDAPVHSGYWSMPQDSESVVSAPEITQPMIDSTLEVISMIVTNIAAGRFPQRPSDSTQQSWIDCDYCDPDGLGVREQRRRFETIARHPYLRDYLALVEPDLVAGPSAVEQ